MFNIFKKNKSKDIVNPFDNINIDDYKDLNLKEKELVDNLIIDLKHENNAITRNNINKIYLPYNYQNLNIIINNYKKPSLYFTSNTIIILPNILLEKEPFYIANYIEKSIKLNNASINSNITKRLVKTILNLKDNIDISKNKILKK